MKEDKRPNKRVECNQDYFFLGQMDLNQSIDCNNIIKIDEEEMKLRLKSKIVKKQMVFHSFISAKLLTNPKKNPDGFFFSKRASIKNDLQ